MEVYESKEAQNKECGGRDLNPRTPARTALEAAAFDRLATSAEKRYNIILTKLKDVVIDETV